MEIGGSIFLMALGAVLAFAVHASVAGLDLAMIGWILMVAGALLLILTVAIFAPRRRRLLMESRGVPVTTTRVVERDDVV